MAERPGGKWAGFRNPIVVDLLDPFREVLFGAGCSRDAGYGAARWRLLAEMHRRGTGY